MKQASHSDEVVEAREILEGLLEALRRERLSLAKLDVDSLVQVNDEKQMFFEQLAVVSPALTKPQRELRSLAIRVRAEAHANAALLRDTAAATAETLGLHMGDETYDRRARRRMSRTFMAGRAA